MLLEEQLPRIQKLIKEKLGTLPTDALQNEVVTGSYTHLTLPTIPLV